MAKRTERRHHVNSTLFSSSSGLWQGKKIEEKLFSLSTVKKNFPTSAQIQASSFSRLFFTPKIFARILFGTHFSYKSQFSSLSHERRKKSLTKKIPFRYGGKKVSKLLPSCGPFASMKIDNAEESERKVID